MKKFLVLSLTIFCAVFLSACQKNDNLTTLSANLTQYDISINLDAEAHTIEADQKVEYINNTNTILRKLKFHLYPQFFEDGATRTVVSNTKLNQAYPNGMSYAKFDISRVTIENEDCPIIYEGEYDGILSIELNSSLLPDEKITIFIEYSILLPNCCHRFGYGNNTINLANFYPILCVYKDGEFDTSPYHANGDPFYSDMANYNVAITLDNQYIVAGTGKKSITHIDNDIKKVNFSAKMVRDFALVISEEFSTLEATHEDTTIYYYYYNDDNADSSLQSGVDSVKIFNDLFGKYPYSTLSIVQCDFVHGGMEYPNLVMISDDITDQNDYMNVIIHEIAHQWWYGIVGNDEYNYPWLDEAITEYSTLLFYDNAKGYEYTHQMMLDSNKSNYTLFITVYEDVLGAIDTSMRGVDQYSTEPEYTYCTYAKGVLMYESLYQLLGKKDFIKGLKIYFNEHKYTNVTPKDLISSFESASKKDLSNFFDSWISGKVIIR